MKKLVHAANTRGKGQYGWLQANYSFSFSHYFNPDRIQFGALRVLNDDFIAPSMGFGTHPHDNMEIITIPLQGALKHKDSVGHEGIIRPGEIQVMSAGTGMQHSEINGSATETTNILQIWILPQERNVAPRYEQRAFDRTEDEFVTVVRPKNAHDDSALWIHQQAYISIGNFKTDLETSYQLKNPQHGVYLFVIEGAVAVAGETLSKRYAIGIWETEQIPFTTLQETQLLLIEVPMD